MQTGIYQDKLYLLVLALGVALVVIALGGGALNQSGFWFEHWQHKAFNGLCHQDPQRSFWIGNTPMAVCSRCFGIYSTFLVSWILFPLVTKPLEFIDGYKRWILFAAVMVNLLDVVGNFFGLWQNTLLSRAFLGGFIGLNVVLILGLEFVSNNQLNTMGIHYGTDRTSGKRST